jgi:guanylate kinase
MRIQKAGSEMKFAEKFDVQILNDQLAPALELSEKVVADFIQK